MMEQEDMQGVLPTDLLTIEEAAKLLGIEPRRIKQLVRDYLLFTVPDSRGKPAVPREIIVHGDHGWEPLFNLPGTLRLLADCGFTAKEACLWLYTDEEQLGQTPMSALIAGKHHRVNSVASALGF